MLVHNASIHDEATLPTSAANARRHKLTRSSGILLDSVSGEGPALQNRGASLTALLQATCFLTSPILTTHDDYYNLDK